MTVTLDIEREDAAAFYVFCQTHPAPWVGGARVGQRVVMEAIVNAIQNHDEAPYDRQQERLMETGGVDDSKYRQDMISAGRGHLLR